MHASRRGGSVRSEGGMTAARLRLLVVTLPTGAAAVAGRYACARGTSHWTLKLRVRLRRGRYRVTSRAVDSHGNLERRAKSNSRRLRV